MPLNRLLLKMAIVSFFPFLIAPKFSCALRPNGRRAVFAHKVLESPLSRDQIYTQCRNNDILSLSARLHPFKADLNKMAGIHWAGSQGHLKSCGPVKMASESQSRHRDKACKAVSLGRFNWKAIPLATR